MNMSEVMTRIKMKLGLMAIASPFIDINESIREILETTTIPQFSVYLPYREAMGIDLNDLELTEDFDYRKVYLLPDFKTRKLYYVFDVRYNSSSMSGLGYYSYGMPFAQGSMINQLMLMNASANLMNTALPKVTFEFRHPRTIVLYNVFVGSRMVFEFGFEHDKTLASVPESARESFMKLALLDVKSTLYETLKQYNELQTAYGNIRVNLDGWDNAESERTELLKEWDDVYHLDVPAPTYG